MKLEVGKTYVTDLGAMIDIVAVTNEGHCLGRPVASSGLFLKPGVYYHYLMDGRSWKMDIDSPQTANILKEYKEPSYRYQPINYGWNGFIMSYPDLDHAIRAGKNISTEKNPFLGVLQMNKDTMEVRFLKQ